MKKFTTTIAIILVISCLFLTLTGCGASIKGTWTDSSGYISYTFESGGKGTMTTMGVNAPFTYEIDGDKITISGVQYTFARNCLAYLLLTQKNNKKGENRKFLFSSFCHFIQ